MTTCTPHPMHQALELSHSAIGLSEPNPRVGAVIIGGDGQVIGQGHTQEAGGPHAEVMALRDAWARGNDVRGASLYVTLEPCCHHGRTGPCTQAIIDAGIGRVIAAAQDPNPQVGGKGMAQLRVAGVETEWAGAPWDEAVRELNIGFWSRMVRTLPWVRLKAAISLDGRTALPNGVSQWITSEPARVDGHRWRARASAVLTGIGTVHQDNPRLDVRAVAIPRQPFVVLVDSRLELPLDAHLWQHGRRLRIYAAAPDPARQRALTDRGAEVVSLPNMQGKVDLPAMLRDLANQGVNELHVEAGAKLAGSLVREGCVDELLAYVAPTLLGEGAPLAAFGPLHNLDAAPALHFHAIDRVGPDLRLVARVTGRERF